MSQSFPTDQGYVPEARLEFHILKYSDDYPQHLLSPVENPARGPSHLFHLHLVSIYSTSLSTRDLQTDILEIHQHRREIWDHLLITPTGIHFLSEGSNRMKYETDDYHKLPLIHTCQRYWLPIEVHS